MCSVRVKVGTTSIMGTLHGVIIYKSMYRVYQRRRNRGGTGGMCPPKFHKLLYKLFTTLCVVSDCAPPIKKSFLRLCISSEVLTNKMSERGVVGWCMAGKAPVSVAINQQM